MKAIGIDEHGKEHSDFRSWQGIKTLFDVKLKELDSLIEDGIETDKNDDIEKVDSSKLLLASCAKKIKSNIQHQLNYVDFFKSDMNDTDSDKLKLAPLTNSACESNFGDLDNTLVSASGSQINLKVVSDKNVIKKNKYFETKEWSNMNLEEKTVEWHWAKTSKAALNYKEIGREYLKKVIIHYNI